MVFIEEILNGQMLMIVLFPILMHFILDY